MELTEGNLAAIRGTMNTPGWLIMEQILLEKFVENRRPRCFVGMKKKTNEQIATEVKAVEISCNSIRGFLTKIKTAVQTTAKKNRNYR